MLPLQKAKVFKKVKKRAIGYSLFCRTASRLPGISEYHLSYPAVTRIFRDIRFLLYHQCELEGRKLSGNIEIDDAYFGGKRKGKRGRGAAGKSVVLGMLERDGKVYRVSPENSH